VVEDEDNSEEDEIVEGFERFRTMRIIFFVECLVLITTKMHPA
jgi:hypothetical protein